jgi:hypothetical protein
MTLVWKVFPRFAARLGGREQTVYRYQETEEPCCVCGKEIQPGQLYIPKGPRHLGCR